MDLPSQYFPLLPCPYKLLKKFPPRKELFSEYGAHQGVQTDVDEVNQVVRCWPQKGQQGIDGLSDLLPSIPLYSEPLDGDWVTKDRILGFSNYNDAVCKMKSTAKLLPLAIQRVKKKDDLKIDITFCIRAAQKMNRSSKHYEEGLDILYEKLPTSVHQLYEKICDIGSASNSECMSGFNRDFCGGLLVCLGEEHSTKLVHVKGATNNEICVSRVHHNPESGLKDCRLTASTTGDPVFQLSASNNSGFVCARRKQSCQIWRVTEHGRLDDKVQMQPFHDTLSSICFSPYCNDEILVSGHGGRLELWNINYSITNLRTAKTKGTDVWSSAHFGGHPRQVVLAECRAVNLLDHRSGFQGGTTLFSLPGQFTKAEEQIMAACCLEYPYHVVATDFALFVIDSRFPGSPVLNFSTEMMSPPQYLQAVQLSGISMDKLIVLGSQQRPEVMCYPVDVRRGRPPTAPVLPWRVAMKDTLLPDDKLLSKRFEFSLAGMAVSSPSSDCAFTVYQLDSCGDIFYQTYTPDPQASRASSRSCRNRSPVKYFSGSSETQREAATKRMKRWLSALKVQCLKAEADKLKSDHAEEIDYIEHDRVFATEILQTTASSFELLEQQKSENTEPVVNPDQPHFNLRSYASLPHASYQSALLLALKDGRDISQLLIMREAAHFNLRKKARMSYLEEHEMAMKNKGDKSSTTAEGEEDMEQNPPGVPGSNAEVTSSLKNAERVKDERDTDGETKHRKHALNGSPETSEDEEEELNSYYQSLTLSESYDSSHILAWLNGETCVAGDKQGLTKADVLKNSKDKEKTPCDLASICSSQRSSTLSRQDIKKHVHPDYSGFLLSPLKKRKKDGGDGKRIEK